MRRNAALVAAVVVGMLLLSTAAHGHVTLNPGTAPAGGFTKLDVRVPNEQDDASTTKLDLQLPDGFASVSYEPRPGWSVRVRRTRLDQPIESEGERITEQVSRVTWTATDGGIEPGQFLEFPISVQIPDRAGSALTFKAIQTYDNGDVSRWIGPPDADEPAPQVEVTAAEEEGGGSAEEEGGAEEEASGGAAEDEDDDSDTLPIIALIVGALGLVTGGAALFRRRPDRR